MLRDTILTCERCDNRFLYAREEQRRKENGAKRPQRCPACRALDRLTGRREGKVKWYSRHKGYGFIQHDGQQDLFLHASEIAEDAQPLQAGQSVSFRIRETERGQRAIDVQTA